MLSRGFGNDSGSDSVSAERKISRNFVWRPSRDKNEDCICFAPHVLGCLSFQIRVEATDAASEAFPVVMLG